MEIHTTRHKEICHRPNVRTTPCLSRQRPEYRQGREPPGGHGEVDEGWVAEETPEGRSASARDTGGQTTEGQASGAAAEAYGYLHGVGGQGRAVQV